MSNLRRPARETDRVMGDHEFEPGGTATVVGSSRRGPKLQGHWVAPRGKFPIVGTLAAAGGHNPYRIKSALDGHDRVLEGHETAQQRRGRAGG